MNTLSISSMKQVSEIDPYKNKIVDLYKRVFGDRIWKEGVKGTAPDCTYKAAFEDRPQNNKCTNTCECDLEDFYSFEEVSKAIQDVFRKECEFVIGLNEDTPVAFYWGWFSLMKELANTKLQLDGETTLLLEKRLQEMYPDTKAENKVYYSAETGVLPEFRGRKISMKLFDRAIENLLAQRERVLVVSRTSRNSPQWKIREQQGFSLLYDYEDADQKGIFVKEYTNTTL